MYRQTLASIKIIASKAFLVFRIEYCFNYLEKNIPREKNYISKKRIFNRLFFFSIP